jgi:hypothetical protein
LVGTDKKYQEHNVSKAKNQTSPLLHLVELVSWRFLRKISNANLQAATLMALIRNASDCYYMK